MGDALATAATLRLLMSHGRPVELVCSGYAHEPVLRNGGLFRVDPSRPVEPGDIALCVVDRLCDPRRVLAHRPDGTLLTALDTFPRGREVVGIDRILGVVIDSRGAGDRIGMLLVRFFPIWSRIAAMFHWWRRILESPVFGASARPSVREKYAQQVTAYSERVEESMDPRALGLIKSRFAGRRSVLVVGSGAGGEAIQLSKEGYRVTGIDFVPAMVDESRQNAAAAGVEVEFLAADVVDVDLGRRFDLVFIGPLVYSFISERKTRVRALGRLRNHLNPGGAVIFTARIFRNPLRWLEALLVWTRRRVAGERAEFGDWHTMFLTPSGLIGKSYIRVFTPWGVLNEARQSGFEHVERVGRAYFFAR